MEEVTVLWFNKQKGYGEGVTRDGRKVFLHYTAAEPPANFVSLEPDQKIMADIRDDKTMDGRPIAYVFRLYNNTHKRRYVTLVEVYKDMYCLVNNLGGRITALYHFHEAEQAREWARRWSSGIFPDAEIIDTTIDTSTNNKPDGDVV